MPVKIRLMRIGAKKRPFYRVVAVDEQKKRTGAYLELLGTYNPLTEPKEILLKQDLIDAWMKKGAQPSDGFLRIIGKAPQKPPRKPKKEKADKPAAAVTPEKEAADAGDVTGAAETQAPVDKVADETAQDANPQAEESQEATADEIEATPAETLAEEETAEAEAETPTEDKPAAEETKE
jgi:small subunit ribosomal protein S16